MPDAPPRAVLSPAFRLVFRLEIANRPGMFEATPDARARGVSAEVELAAARALAGTVRPEVRSAEYILPSVFDRDVVPRVAKAVAAATREAGLARKTATAEP